MSAQEHLNPKLFHASPHLFKKGELVKPGVDGAMSIGGVVNKPHAYATSDPAMAKDIAERSAEKNPENGAWINEVEPSHDMTNVFEHLQSTGFTGTNDPLLPYWRHNYGNEHASQTGYVATGRATFVSNNSKKNVSTPEGRD
jgi:hypothetical protein